MDYKAKKRDEDGFKKPLNNNGWAHIHEYEIYITSSNPVKFTWQCCWCGKKRNEDKNDKRKW